MFKLSVIKNNVVVHNTAGQTEQDCLAQLQPYFEHKTFGEPEITEQVLVSEAIPEVTALQEVIISPEEIDEETGEVIKEAITEMQEVVIQEAVEAVYETVVTPADYEIVCEDVSAQVAQEQINAEALAYLASTDFKVLRHIRQQALGETTSLTQEEYLMLEQERSNAANRIIKIVD